MNSNILYIYRANKQKAFVGRLVFAANKVTFQYAKSFIEDNHAPSINDFHLPKIKQEFSETGLTGILNVFNDALPGIWGKHVLNTIKGRKLSDAELLLEDQKNRIGDLVFSSIAQFPDITHNFLVEPFDWAELLAAKESIEHQDQLTEKQQGLLKNGSGQGGARPKLTLLKDRQLYLIKLPSERDYSDDNQETEHATMRLANACGINVAQTELLAIKQQNILLVRRFDRDELNQSLAYLSLASVCSVRNSSDASYLDFADELQRRGCQEQLTELFKRMLFNVLVSNKDDHLLNHGIIYVNHKWSLSPAFDLVAGEGQSKEHSLTIGAFGKLGTLGNVLSKASAFNLSAENALLIVKNMLNTMRGWQPILRNAGISEHTIKSVNWAILHDDIFKDVEFLKEI